MRRCFCTLPRLFRLAASNPMCHRQPSALNTRYGDVALLCANHPTSALAALVTFAWVEKLGPVSSSDYSWRAARPARWTCVERRLSDRACWRCPAPNGNSVFPLKQTAQRIKRAFEFKQFAFSRIARLAARCSYALSMKLPYHQHGNILP